MRAVEAIEEKVPIPFNGRAPTFNIVRKLGSSIMETDPHQAYRL